MKKYFYSLVMIFLIAAISGCANPYNNEGEGAVTGGAIGALAGGIIGHQSRNTGAGILLGGALGAVTGAAVGSQVQKPVYEEPVVAQPAPAVVAGAPDVAYSGDTATVNVPNDNGGYTAVVLKRSGNGYLGPQGEYYDQIPTTAQLKAMYGR